MFQTWKVMEKIILLGCLAIVTLGKFFKKHFFHINQSNNYHCFKEIGKKPTYIAKHKKVIFAYDFFTWSCLTTFCRHEVSGGGGGKVGGRGLAPLFLAATNIKKNTYKKMNNHRVAPHTFWEYVKYWYDKTEVRSEIEVKYILCQKEDHRNIERKIF